MGKVGWGGERWREGTAIQVKREKQRNHPQCLIHPFIFWYQCRLFFYISGCIWIYNCRRPPHDVHATQPLSSSASMQYICRRSRDCVLVALVEVVAFICGSDDTHTFCLFCWFTVSHQGALWAWFGSANSKPSEWT